MEIKGKAFEDIIVGAEKEMNFSIDSDNSLIFEILRDKMYKDKIGSICREVMSNCRDANREAGSDKNVSVTIIEPDQLSYVGHQSVSFRDNGVGISPDRMADVYVKYASSTKTGSNDQTGGFGLGAKTPFAYNDTFTVVTVCDVEGQRLKYYYTALIDSTRKGKMILFEVEESTEDTGTQVIVPIKTPSDRREFEEKAFFYTKYWGCVDYINFNSEPDAKQIYYSTPKFDIVEGGNTSLIIDGIPYPLESGWGFKNLSMSRNYGVALKFNTGELTISANRESVQYDEDTVAAIKQRGEDVYDELLILMYQFLGNFGSYIEACTFKASIDNQILPAIKEGNDMFNIITSAIGIRNYTSYVLRQEYMDADFTFGGRKVVTKLSYKHHSIKRVMDVDYIKRGNKTKVYKDYGSLPLAQLDACKMFYGDKKGDSRRNATIFDEVTSEDRFFMITPNSFSTAEEVEEELCTMRDLFGIHYHSYLAVEPMKIERASYKKVSSKIAATQYDGYCNDSLDIYYEKNSNKLYHDVDCTRELDKNNYCFMPVSRVTNRVNGSIRTNLDLINGTMKVILVNKDNFEKRVSKCGYRAAKDVWEEVITNNTKQWLEEGKKFLIGEALRYESSKILDYLDVLPVDILPKSFRDYEAVELKMYYKYSNSYTLTASKILINKSGLKSKLKSNLSKYPLLISYIEHSYDSFEKKKDSIREYVNQVNK